MHCVRGHSDQPEFTGCLLMSSIALSLYYTPNFINLPKKYEIGVLIVSQITQIRPREVKEIIQSLSFYAKGLEQPNQL